MALKLTLELNSGQEGNYWKIGNYSTFTDKCEIQLLLFKDKATREAGKSSMFSNNFTVDFIEQDITGTVRHYLYTQLKNLPYFSSASDI